MPVTLLHGLYKFRKVFFLSMALYDIKGRIPCMGTSPERACTHINQKKSESESESKSVSINCASFELQKS